MSGPKIDYEPFITILDLSNFKQISYFQKDYFLYRKWH